MKVFVTINGYDSILGGYSILALTFYQKELPPRLVSACDYIKSKNPYIPQEKDYKKLMSFKDFFYYEYDLIPTYEQLNDYLKWRNTAQRLVLNIRAKLLRPLDEVIYNKLIPSSTDFKVTYANKIDDYLELYIAHQISRYIRAQSLTLLKTKFPVYKLDRHLGSKSPIHFSEILHHGICQYHHPDTLDFTAKFIQRSINHKLDVMVQYKNLFNRLPVWWRRATDKYSLKDYFTEEELIEMKANLKICHKHKMYKNSERSLVLPRQRDLPYRFKQWLKDNPC